ncbi:hypothetical protein L518_0627 [Bordetella bronchiseptica MBORD675]|nr:hypothetical protein L530_0905 [Bordetella bronchiseptica MO211]KDC98513.1 hypothetical protein L518_0627 [Bordetella bronchiseptica MBORD675]
MRGRRRPIDLLFNLEHPDQLAVVTEVEENGDDEDDADDDSELIGDETDSTEDELLKRFNKMTFVVATRHRCWKWKATRLSCLSDARGLQRR